MVALALVALAALVNILPLVRTQEQISAPAQELTEVEQCQVEEDSSLLSLATERRSSRSSGHNSNLGTFDCNNFQLNTKAGGPIELKHRSVPARIIDTFAFGNKFEVEELVLRLYEMGSEVSEFHIVEGDKDFTGASKAYEFPAILQSGKLDRWKAKITYHKAQIPAGVKAYDLQNSQRLAMQSEMRETATSSYDPSDILLEGDLDEIPNHLVLQALKHCAPVSGVWNAHIQMANLYYSAGWTNGNLQLSTTAAYFSESPLQDSAGTGTSASMFLAQSIWTKPNLLSLKHGMGQSGWHFSWTLNGTQGLARKIFIHVEGFPTWARGFADEAALAKFLDESFYADIQKYDRRVFPSRLGKDTLPRALSEHPEEFPTILRGVVL
eukprot:symbB.v1.2.021772.t1/scaffold1821.1/size219240/11